MTDNRVKELGEGQWKWLNKYNNINLQKWRYMFVGDKPDWFYIGDWTPGPTEMAPSTLDGGYYERQNNIEHNRYYYWPPNPV